MGTIDEGDQDKLFIKLINHLTGEQTEVEITTAEQAKNLLIELSASESVISKAKENLKYYLDRFLGDNESYQFADGKILRRVQRNRLQYRVETLKKYLDEDQLSVVLKVDTGAANALITEMIAKNELPGDTMRLIKEDADHLPSKAYVEVR